MLTRLHGRKRLTVIGLNSGTSADGIDVAAVAIQRERGRCRVRLLDSLCRRYSISVRQAVLKMADAPTVGLDDLIRLDQVLGQLFGRAARVLMNRLAKSGRRVDLIASHGQTVRHLPGPASFLNQRVRGTLQLGNLERIAAITGRPVAGDFRQADVAVGGEGAPITAGAVQRLLADPNESRLIVNIGGMANLFYFPAKATSGRSQTRDCGPGNVLCDILAQRFLKAPFDRNGRLASTGTVSKHLLSQLARHLDSADGTISTGREQFGPPLLDRLQSSAKKRHLTAVDLMATAVEFTAKTIAAAVNPIIRRDRSIASLYLTGGGRHNSFLVERLDYQLERIAVRPVEELGFDGDFLEAVSYAVMGEAALRGEALPIIAGRSKGTKRPILGRLVQPPIADRNKI